jgi:hypothetical protein
MSSANTPVTQADVDEWARDIGAHSNNVSGPVYYNVSKAKWDQVHDMLGRLLAAQDELRRNYDAVAQAVGVAYEADGHDAVGGPVDQVVAQASRNRVGAMIADEWQQRAKKLDADVDHFHKKWKDAETRAEKAEASSGVAMLRRLVVWLNAGQAAALKTLSCQDTAYVYAEVRRHVDRMIAEAEKHAEPCEKPQQDFAGNVCSWKSSKTARQCVETALELADAPSLDDDQLDAVAALLDGPRPKDREGDDVLRALDHHLRAMSDHTDPDRWRGSVESALRTIRRALGEEVKS